MIIYLVLFILPLLSAQLGIDLKIVWRSINVITEGILW